MMKSNKRWFLSLLNVAMGMGIYCNVIDNGLSEEEEGISDDDGSSIVTHPPAEREDGGDGGNSGDSCKI